VGEWTLPDGKNVKAHVETMPGIQNVPTVKNKGRLARCFLAVPKEGSYFFCPTPENVKIGNLKSFRNFL